MLCYDCKEQAQMTIGGKCYNGNAVFDKTDRYLGQAPRPKTEEKCDRCVVCGD